ncbi:hypothetical protein DV515_00009314 [Chloebia gouldiae]|uniref:Uncharacterized protein n=1 Tax=Chloebia gouldiae TaxID=44316 RepID=A0A3L8SC62_CHLGU|nr:hypothetical protein DV515_00009314 [Chloebia gouldiae]
MHLFHPVTRNSAGITGKLKLGLLSRGWRWKASGGHVTRRQFTSYSTEAFCNPARRRPVTLPGEAAAGAETGLEAAGTGRAQGKEVYFKVTTLRLEFQNDTWVGGLQKEEAEARLCVSF